MIYYSKGWHGLKILLQSSGALWPHGILPGLFSAGISLAMCVEDADTWVRSKETFIGHPYVYRLMAVLLGLAIIFRSNFAYQRYWEAADALQKMAAKWLDGALMGIVFDAGGDSTTPLLHGADWMRSAGPHPTTFHKGGPDHRAFFKDIVHLCSLMHGLAMMRLRDDSNMDNIVTAENYARQISCLGKQVTRFADLQQSLSASSSFYGESLDRSKRSQKIAVIGGLRPEERKALENDSQGNPLPNCARVSMVETWFMRRLIARQKFEQGESAATDPPILSRLYQVISDGTLWYGVACKSAQIPWPFPHANFVEVMLWLFTVMTPFIVNNNIVPMSLRLTISFAIAFTYHTLRATNDVLEDPYIPYGPNDLPLPAWQHSFNMRLLAMGPVSDEEYIPPLPVPDTSAAAAQVLESLAHKGPEGKSLDKKLAEVARETKMAKSKAAEVLEEEFSLNLPTPQAHARNGHANDSKAKGKPLKAGCFPCLPATIGASFVGPAKSHDDT
eukprot:TRINITY_DN62259_c0_g1_i1.p1 TRINITY_DN62259_c0_g1~~TRINITY_DN62259_c0_g1_i1.p1  ORF type:complete len:502 (-),score=76.03 TRINITY_DN62259_c0_g1_i1:42-1547(-)